jgi:lipopolysaccharide biosynthesis protein
VFDALLGRVPLTFTLEGEPVPDELDRVAVVAQYSRTPRLSRSFQRLVEQLRANDYFVIVSSTTEAGELEWPEGRPAGVSILRRPNIGYDFGSWAVALNSFPQVRVAARVLTVNDSIVGPFSALAPLIRNFEDAGTPVWGAVRSHQFAPHLQSYFLGFSGGTVLARGPIRRFWRGVSVQGTKTDVIWKYEIGLSQLLRKAGIDSATAFDGMDVVGVGVNPVIIGWHSMLVRGFPFVKRELLVRPEVAPDSAEIPRVISDLFDEEIAAWV